MNAVSGLDSVKVKCDFFEFCLSCYVNPVAIVCKHGLWLRIINEHRPWFSTTSNLCFEFCSSFFSIRENSSLIKFSSHWSSKQEWYFSLKKASYQSAFNWPIAWTDTETTALIKLCQVLFSFFHVFVYLIHTFFYVV